MFVAIITELLVVIQAYKKTALILFTARWCPMQQQISQNFPDHPTLEHICVCTNLAGIVLSPSVYCSIYHSTTGTNYLSSVRYSWSLCINSSNRDVLTTIEGLRTILV